MRDFIDTSDRSPEDFTQLDPDTEDEQYYYRWVQSRDANIVKKRVRGFEFADSEEEKTLFDLDQKKADGRIHFGDTVLMKMKKTQKRARDERKLERARSMLRGADSEVVRRAQEGGVKLYDKEE